MYKMYDEIADWWLLLSPKEDYAEEAGFFVKTMRDKGLPSSPTLLELGAGGGNTAYYLKSILPKSHFQTCRRKCWQLADSIIPNVTISLGT